MFLYGAYFLLAAFFLLVNVTALMTHDTSIIRILTVVVFGLLALISLSIVCLEVYKRW